MKQIFKYILFCSTFLFVNKILSEHQDHSESIDCCPKESKYQRKTFFLPRSQGTNTARWLSGWERFLAPYPCHIQNGALNLVIERTDSFHGGIISDYLFGNNYLKFKGSQICNRNPETDIIADNFGLSTTYQGTLYFNPKIRNVIIEVNYYLALDTWIEGLYTRIHFPLTITSWDLGVKVKENTQELRPIFPDCYMSNNNTRHTQTLSSIKQALSGYGLFGDMNSPFDFGKFPFCANKKSGIADIYLVLGWTACGAPTDYLAFFLQTIIPGGNKPCGIKFFEPIVGNGRRWEVGFGSEGRLNLLSSENQSLDIFFLGYVNYRFKAFQIRSFDYLYNGFFSRYMLLKEYNKNLAYAGNMLNSIDYTTKAARAGDNLIGDASFKLSYYIWKFGFDIGYNIWGTTAERINIVKSVYPSDLNHRAFGFKGTTGICYRTLNENTGTITDGSFLNATSTQSTITQAGPIDNPLEINLENGEIPITWDSPSTGNVIVAQNSNPLVKVRVRDLDRCSAAVPSQLSHKFFAHIGYTHFGVDWEPELGLGGEVEFNGRRNLKTTIDQWGIWLKGQVAF